MPYASWLEWHPENDDDGDDDEPWDASRSLELVCVARCDQSVTKPSSASSRLASSTVLLPPAGSGRPSTSQPAARETIVALTRTDDATPIARELQIVPATGKATPKCLGVCLWRDNPKSTSLLALFDDGSLRAYDAPVAKPTAADAKQTTDLEDVDDRVDLPTDDDDDMDDDMEEDDWDRPTNFEDDLSSSLVSGTTGRNVPMVQPEPTSQSKLPPEPPCTIFESLHVLPAHRVVIIDAERNSASTTRHHQSGVVRNEEHIVGTRSDGGTVLVRVAKPERLAAVRILLGSVSLDHVPGLLVVGGHRIPTARERRWYDVILTDDDRRRAVNLGALVVSLVDLRTTSTIAPMIDAIEAYTDVPLESTTTTSKSPRTQKSRRRPEPTKETTKDEGCRGSGFVKMTNLERTNCAAPTLQRAVVAAARARVALRRLDTKRGETTVLDGDSWERECFFDLDSAPSKDTEDDIGLGVVMSSKKDDDDSGDSRRGQSRRSSRRRPRGGGHEEAAQAKEPPKSEAATVAAELVKLTCLAKDKVRWPGLRAAASTLCDVAADFDRSKAKILADGARLEQLGAAIRDDDVLNEAPASVAYLALALAKARP